MYSHDGFVVCERAFWATAAQCVYSHGGFVCERALRPRLLTHVTYVVFNCNQHLHAVVVTLAACLNLLCLRFSADSLCTLNLI